MLVNKCGGVIVTKYKKKVCAHQCTHTDLLEYCAKTAVGCVDNDIIEDSKNKVAAWVQ